VWKKEEEQPVRPTVATAASPEPARAPAARSAPATIGPSIVVRGEVSGSEDLLVQGRIDGSIALNEHSVTVGGGGRVKANISGRVITIEGEVEGDLDAQEQIVLRGSSKVLGDIKAPRVVLEDGASFRGLVDMGSQRAPEKSAGAAGGAAKGGASATSSAPKAPQQPPSSGSTPGQQEGKGSAARPAAGSGRDAERKTGS
jgi:cytoskeletal protein CcmA (bactofilin family)